jgi:uncharacterized membrane protein YeaQ/YmgE (transglycosylase-associated protein family)
MITGIILWIIIGAIAGALGKLIMPGDDPGGIIATILIGIAGAFVGGFITQNVLGMGSGGLYGPSSWLPSGRSSCWLSIVQ